MQLAEARERSFAAFGRAKDSYKENVTDPVQVIFNLCRKHWKKTLAVLFIQFLIVENAVHHIAEIAQASHGIIEITKKVLLSFTGN